jgi:hypothetical protein
MRPNWSKTLDDVVDFIIALCLLGIALWAYGLMLF